MKNLIFLSLLCSVVVTAEDLSTSMIITIQGEQNSLSNNYDSQSSNYIELFLKRSDNLMGGVKGEKVSRYNLDDNRIESYLIAPISKRLQGSISYTRADAGVVIPKTTVSSALLYDFGSSYQASLSRKTNKYTLGSQSNTNTINLIKYYKNYRFSYAHDITHVKNAGQSTNDTITGHYFYGSHHTAISLSSGVELESIANGRVLSPDVKSISVYGEYWLLQNWGFRYSINYSEQGDLYTKKGGSLAAIYRF
jgi:YaiO family outer membrane protein